MKFSQFNLLCLHNLLEISSVSGFFANRSFCQLCDALPQLCPETSFSLVAWLYSSWGTLLWESLTLGFYPLQNQSLGSYPSSLYSLASLEYASSLPQCGWRTYLLSYLKGSATCFEKPMNTECSQILKALPFWALGLQIDGRNFRWYSLFERKCCSTLWINCDENHSKHRSLCQLQLRISQLVCFCQW